MRAVLLAFCTALSVSALASEVPPANVDELDAALARTFVETHVPGAAVAVIEDGQVVLLKGYGYADVSRKVAATPDTVFRAGSISKAFTSIGVMALVETGQLDLDARLADLAPEISFSNPWEETHPVRLAHLLEHTTGWPDIPLRIYTLDGKDWSTLQGVEAASPGFVSRYPPGEFSLYNNAGPAVAGYIVEKKSGKTFSDYMRTSVLRPMGMPTADFDMPPAIAARLSKSYEPDGSETPYQYIVLPPAGSLATSARELSELVRFFVDRGSVDGKAVLSERSVQRIERSETTLASKAGFTNGYGLGNAPFPDSGISFRGHNGSIDSFTSVFGYRVTGRMGFVLLANGGDGVDFDSAATQVVKSYLLRHSSPVAETSKQIAATPLARFAGFYRTITPPNRLLEPYIDILGLTRVADRADRLVISGKDFFPSAPNVFRRADREAPSIAFVEDNADVYKITAFNAQARASIASICLIWLTGGLLIAGLLMSIAMAPVWLVALLRRRYGLRDALVRFLPLFGYLALVATFALPIMEIATPGMIAMHRLADIGPYSLTIFACSVLFPICALVGAWLAWRRENPGTFVRVYATTALFGMGIAACYAASIGWLGARTWAM